jgi:Skp family chaperone for outer membrane proteins
MNIDKKHISSLIKDLEVDKKLQVKLESTQDEIDTNQVKEHQKSKIKQRLYDASKMIKENKEKSKLSSSTNS